MKPRSCTIGRVYKGPAPGANTDIFATSLKPGEDHSAFRVTVCLATASVLNLIMDNGTDTLTMGLGASATLNAGDLYTYVFDAPKTDDAGAAITYNFQVETDGVINLLVVTEIIGGVL